MAHASIVNVSVEVRATIAAAAPLWCGIGDSLAQTHKTRPLEFTIS